MAIDDESLRQQIVERTQLLREKVQTSTGVLLAEIQASEEELLKSINDAKNNEMMDLLKGALTRLDRIELLLDDKTVAED